MAYISARPFVTPPTRSVEESVRSVREFAARKAARKNYQPPKDPNDFYRRNGSAFAAEESAKEMRRRLGERDE